MYLFAIPFCPSSFDTFIILSFLCAIPVCVFLLLMCICIAIMHIICFYVLSCFSPVWLFTTPWTVLSARILERITISSSRLSSWTRDRTCISRMSKWILYHLSHLGSTNFCTQCCSEWSCLCFLVFMLHWRFFNNGVTSLKNILWFSRRWSNFLLMTINMPTFWVCKSAFFFHIFLMWSLFCSKLMNITLYFEIHISINFKGWQSSL